MAGETITKPIDSSAFGAPVDLEMKSGGHVPEAKTPDGSLVEAPPLSFQRLMVLFSLANLFIGAGVAVLFLGAGLGIRLILPTLIVIAYTVADISGAGSQAWLGVANTLSVAAVSPIAGSVSDLIGRRHACLLASAFVCIGCIVVGTAHRIDVAIGGSAITGVGSGLAETVGTAALLELAPVKSRGL